ncbi:hypothetical protein N9E83_01400, partial [Ascidiaceihabitans sp.]|nr:hypothetical protein [Ascidiaceihabitans sp.]
NVTQVYGLTESYGHVTECVWRAEDWDDLDQAAKAGAAFIILGICHTMIAIDYSGSGGEHMGGAAQMRQRRKWYIVGRTFAQTCFVVHPAHMRSPLRVITTLESCGKQDIASTMN